MRLKTGLKVGAAGLVVIAIGLVAAVKAVDVNAYRGLLADAAKQATGRDLVIHGRFDLKPSLSPTLVAEEVVFANAAWGSRPEMVRIKRVEAEIGLLPLLRREVQVRRLVLVDPDILVQTDAKGQGNWAFEGGQGQAAEAERGKAPLFKVGEVTIQNGKLTWRDGVQGTATEMTLAKFTAEAESLSSPVAITAAGSFDKRPFDLRGVLGPAIELQQQSKPYPLKLKLTSGGIVAAIDGMVGDVQRVAGYDAKLTLEGSELAELTQLLKLPPGLVGPFRIGATVTDEKTGKLQINGIDAALGRQDILLLSVKGAVKDPLAGGGLDLVVNAETQNLATLSDLVGTALPSVGPMRLAVHASDPAPGQVRLRDLKLGLGRSDLAGEATLHLPRGGRSGLTANLSSTMLDIDDLSPPGSRPAKDGDPDRVFPTHPLPIGFLKEADFDVSLRAERLILAGAIAQGVEARAKAEAGRLVVRPLTGTLAGGKTDAEITIDAAAAQPVVGLKLKGNKVDLGTLLRETRTTDVLEGGRAELSIDLRGAGPSWRAIMSSLDGEAAMVVDQGKLNNLGADLIALDVLRQATPWAEKVRDTEMKCLVSRFTVEKGLATSQAFLFDTSHMTVGGTGKINLANEGLNLTVVPRPKEASLLTLATAMDVGGTLMHPSVMPNKAALAKGVVGAVGAVALGPLGALVPFVNTGSANQNPCLEALSAARKGGAKAGSAKAPATQQGGGGLGGLLQGILGN